ncbi:hypothetical protein SDC9_92927 [bioreactor metagenome]|uniref:Uncharacterized protein n=1 Tax=bioreactor metagenome TaxID=1076179 RepID=A0A644ZZ39_9ZZZZ
MHGLAVFQHHIVGDIHDVVDGAHAGVAQTLPEPGGGGGDFYVFHHAGGVAGTEVGIFDLHIKQIGNRTARALYLGRMQAERGVEGDRRLPGQADDREAVGAVRGDFEFHHMVVQTKDGFNAVAGFAVLPEDKDAVLDGIGVVVDGKAQLLERAEHAVGFHTPKFTRGDVDPAGQIGIVQGDRNQVASVHVLRAGDDLDQIGQAHIHKADEHMIGIGMGLDLRNPAHHDVADFSSDFLGELHLGAGEGHGFGELPVGDGDIHKFSQPFS